MSEPETEKTGFDEMEKPFASRPGAGETETGEYHFTGDKIYSDAHYEPAGASTEPPRYYTPPERPVKEPRTPREKKKSPWPGILALCLVCIVLGGALGGMLADRRADLKLNEMEQRLNETIAEQIASVNSELDALRANAAAAGGGASGLSGAQIFDQAKYQVVGISTDVTYQNFFGMTTSTAVSGSGFIISEDGYILTNYHVVETANLNGFDVSVMLYDGEKYTASIVGFDDGNDVAVLKIDASGLSAVTMGNSDRLTMGETIYAVGNPLGELAYSMSTGTVSGLDRVIQTEDTVGGVNMFQIDAAVNHGNSGGPVYNSLGEVVGIVTAKSGETDAEGLGFAIPINDAAHIASDVMTVGYVTGKAFMGVRFDERYNSMYAQYYNMPLGAYIYSVEADSAAERAGLLAGDIVTAIDSSAISTFSDIKTVLRSYSAGDTAQIYLYRGGETIEKSITFDEARPAGYRDAANTVLDQQTSDQS